MATRDEFVRVKDAAELLGVCTNTIRTWGAAAIEQSKRYSRGFTVESNHQSCGGPWADYNIPFLFSTNGRPFLRQIAEKSGIWFLDARRIVNHPRPLEAWYTPELHQAGAG
ncbi:MAG: hypothetical protein WKF77_27275 [Planctomycetaceae bacterium]